jgi:putative chitinase
MLLKVGSKGEDVKKLQAKLGLTADGIFGSGTEKSVKKWQIDNDVTPDGIVGNETWNKMFGVSTKPAVSTPSQQQSTISSVGNLKLKNLKGHVPDNVISQIPDTASKFEINTPLRLAHFLAQCAHESGNFKLVSENLNYSAKGLKSVFSKYFKEAGLAESYERKPELIGSRVYGGRMGNGIESTKEGYKFRGRGYIQLTGKDNYRAFGNSIGVDVVSNPDLVSTKYPLLSAAWFFKSRCLSKCDAGSSDEVVTSVTKCVNGGTNGLSDRIKHFKEFYNLLK